MTRRVKKMYEEYCIYDYDEEVCREFAEDDLSEELYKDEKREEEEE
jgi:hypothetical protein